MADIKDEVARSLNMSLIHGKNTKPELFVRHMLFAEGYRYRIHSKSVPGHPDLWLKKYNTAVFVNGCFWHRHRNCKYAYNPKSRVDFWKQKFADNVRRDIGIYSQLGEQGIKCLVIWECSVKKMNRDSTYGDVLLQNIKTFLKNCDLFLEL